MGTSSSNHRSHSDGQTSAVMGVTVKTPVLGHGQGGSGSGRDQPRGYANSGQCSGECNTGAGKETVSRPRAGASGRPAVDQRRAA